MTITPETIAELRGLAELHEWDDSTGWCCPILPNAIAANLPALLNAAERLAEVTAERDAVGEIVTQLAAAVASAAAERDALAARMARVRAQVEEWEARASFNEASLVHHPDNFWHGMATKGRECADEARRALDGSGS